MYETLEYDLKSSHFMQESNFYYIIEQNINNLVQHKHNCYDSLARVKLLCAILCGDISVYKVNEKTNQYENLTDIYGKREHINEKEELVKAQTICYQSKESFKTYFFDVVCRQQQYEQSSSFEENDENGRTRHFIAKYSKNISFFTLETIHEHQKNRHQYNDTKGESYEKFIGAKYETLGYSVIYHGIEQKFNDQGIDLIAQKENNIIFVQCKNWIGGKFNKLFRKDLQAFAGDCFLFMQKTNHYNLEFNSKKISLHFIVNKNELLDKSAILFLEQNSFIKFKIIEFQE